MIIHFQIVQVHFFWLIEFHRTLFIFYKIVYYCILIR